jgi:HEAT repeat protein
MPRTLIDGSPAARVAAMATLVRRATAPEDDELEALCKCLGDPSKPVQRAAAEAFAALAARGVEVGGRLGAVLAAPDLRWRWGAAYALSLLGAVPLAALPTLLEVLGSDDGDLRWAAAEVLKRLAAVDRATVLAALLAAARSPGARRKMALYALRDLEVPEAFDAALAALADESTETRLAALAAIAKVHPEPGAAARRIAALIDDPDPRMQRAAAGTLGSLGVRSDDVLSALQRAAQSPDGSLCRAALRSLRQLES